MDVFYGFDSLRKIANPVVTMGSYDGVHAGHREILRNLNATAREIKGESVVITFSPHPREVIFGVSQKLLNTLDEKIIVLEQQGIDVLIVVPFTMEFGSVEPYEFVKEYLVGKVGVRKLIVGYDHHFGKGNRGDIALLRSLQCEFGFEVMQIPQYNVDSNRVSSTIVRDSLANGRMAEVNRYIGYEYFICGDLSEDGTVSLRSENKLLPPSGRYNVVVDCEKKRVETILNISDNGGQKVLKMDCKGWVSSTIVKFL